MQNHTLEYDEIDAIFAVTSAQDQSILIDTKVDIAWNLLNGGWEYTPNQMSYQGYSSQERMCEVEAMKGKWDASGQSV